MSSTQVTVTESRPASDDYTLHKLSDPRYVIWEKPRGRDRFEVTERGAGRRGTGRDRGTARTLAAALELAATLAPSTPAEILAGCEVFGDRDRALLRELTALGTPGTPLFVLADGKGYESVSEGLAANAVECLFGDDGLGCWLVSWRDPQGDLVRGLYCMARDDAERAWWILRDGKVVAGGPPIFDESRALELAEQYGGTAVKGTRWATPDPAPVSRCRRPGCNRPLRSASSVATGIGPRCAAKERAEKKREALENVLRIVTAPFSARQVEDANKLIAAGKLRPANRPGLWLAESSDGVTVYRCCALYCPCRAKGPCKHMAAVSMVEAYEAFGEVA